METELITSLGAGTALLVIVISEILQYLRDRRNGHHNNPGPSLNLDPITEKLETLTTVTKSSHNCIKELNRSIADLDASWKRSIDDLKAIAERSSEDVIRAVRNVEERVTRLERSE